ncbi:hypothetical protein IFM89_009003 [Coptis chinensis]|uniref:Pentatricopeptide repeat-containing protein n=1 Tax=Coptis chinensis TaxID=261450 RepID=A0A835HLA1_9MAGN|nr:hypothetical protein IFM89_009003 [Coptis chinensis]
MVRCYGMNESANDAVGMFSDMVDSGIQPDGISFISVLSACSHAGLVDKGWELFRKMANYGVDRWEEHYACMVDLLGMAGQLNKALELIESMPVKGGKDVYGALLGACRIHNNIDLAERLFVLDSQNAGRYIILAKMYEDAGRWTDAAGVRKALREKQIKKQPGCSAVEVDCILHTFGVEDESHPLKGQIFDTLEQLEKIIEEDLIE